MTQKQIDKVKNDLYFKYYGDNSHTIDNLKQKWTRQDEILEQELNIREMINSMLIYGSNTNEGSYSYNEYLKPYYEGSNWRNKGFVNRQRVLELIDEQKQDFAKAKVGFAGYDSEGVSYNYCKWGDEE